MTFQKCTWLIFFTSQLLHHRKLFLDLSFSYFKNVITESNCCKLVGHYANYVNEPSVSREALSLQQEHCLLQAKSKQMLKMSDFCF